MMEVDRVLGKRYLANSLGNVEVRVVAIDAGANTARIRQVADSSVGAWMAWDTLQELIGSGDWMETGNA
jgi:enoyl-[acyl-carrier-protein] reductase (NADH)